MENLQAILEGLLFLVGDEGVTLEQLSTILEISEPLVQQQLDQMQKRYLEIVYDEAKKVNPEACISTFTPNPCLSDFCDMVRLGDMYSTRLSTISAMRERAAIYHDTLPYTLVDTDGQFEHCLGEEPAAILREQAKLGIPTLYNALLINRGHMFQPSRLVPLSDADYQSFSAYYRPPE